MVTLIYVSETVYGIYTIFNLPIYTIQENIKRVAPGFLAELAA